MNESLSGLNRIAAPKSECQLFPLRETQVEITQIGIRTKDAYIQTLTHTHSNKYKFCNYLAK